MAAAAIPPRPVQVTFVNISLTEIGARCKYDLNATAAWCRQHGLLASEMKCPTCDDRGREQQYARSVDGLIWRCSTKRCKKRSVLGKAAFLRSHICNFGKSSGLLIAGVLAVAKAEHFHNILKHKLGISSPNTVVDWNQYCRDVAAEYSTNHHEQLGGPGSLVEIDESLFARRKNNVGRVVPDQWVFGAYEPATKKGFLLPVPRRDAVSLLPIIIRWIAPGTTIWSDQWAAYNNLYLNKASFFPIPCKY